MEELIHILLVEDDPHKLVQLRGFFANEYKCARFEEKHSFQSGLKYAMLDAPDVLVLDMTMTTYVVEGSEKGGRERRYAGEEILRRLRRRGILIPAIIVTQFEQFGEGDEIVTLEELKTRLTKSYPSQYIGAVYYQGTNAQWKVHLRTLLESVRPSRNRGEQ
jgi:DNA-binding NarL/FixJ family response regulator